MFLGFIVFAAIVAAALWFVSTYNYLVATKQRVARAWANLDVPVRERHDELPRLVEICAKYLRNDQAALDRVLEARSAIFAARHSFDPAVLAAPRSTCAASSARCCRSRKAIAISRRTSTSGS
jgi:LemA protein